MDKIGIQSPHMKQGLVNIKKSFNFSTIEMQNFYIHTAKQPIHLLLGTPNASLFFKEVSTRQINKYHPPTCPNLILFWSPLMVGKLNFGGILGIHPKDTISHLLIHKYHLKMIQQNQEYYQKFTQSIGNKRDYSIYQNRS